MTRNEIIKKLRDGEPIKLYREKMFIQIQLNKRDKGIHWERWVSIDQRNWMNWNLFLSLKEVLTIIDNGKNQYV